MLMSQQAISKTKLSKGTTIPLINNFKLVFWHPVDKVFNSFIASTLLYSALIWCLRQLDDIGKINLAYYKKILNHPRNTPDCAVRIETGSKHISLRILKMILNWLQKLYDMNKKRYPRIRFERLRFIIIKPRKDIIRLLKLKERFLTVYR